MTAPVVAQHISAIFSSGTSGASGSLSTNTGDMIVVCIHSENPTNAQSVSTVTDTIGNTYTRRKQMQWTAATGTKNVMELWYAKSTGTNATNAVTVTLSVATDDAGFVALTVTGQNASAPWDPNGSLPGSANDPNSTNNPTVTGLSTNNANSLIIAFSGAGTNNSPTVGTIAGVTATLIDSWSNNGAVNFSRGLVESASFTAVQSNFSASITSINGSWGIIADVITADAGPPLAKLTKAYVFT